MAEPLQSSRTGDLLNGIYELHETLGSSAEHDTYRATDTRRASSVQITMLKAELALRSGAVERFLELPRSLAGLRHPHVTQTLGIELDETGIPFVVQEDVQGEPLAKTLAGFAQGMPLGMAVAVLSPVIDAVAAAHALGLVHGRLNREQILLVRAGGSSVPKLTGFGQAPEGADSSSDVWALGALLYEALSGESAGRPGKLRTPLDELAPHLPAELAALVEHCLERDPSTRPKDAGVVRDALAKVTGSMRTGDRKSEPQLEPAPSKPATPFKPAVASKPAVVSKPAVAPKPSPKPTPVSAPPPRKLRAGEEATEPVEAPPSRISAVAATVADDKPFGLDRTMAMPVSAASLQSAIEHARERSEPPADGFDLADADDHAAAQAADDEPELSFEAPAGSSPPQTMAGRRSKRPKPDVMTASDLAAAFAPIEGAERIGQSETAEAAMVRGFKQSFEDAQAASKAAKRGGRAGAAAGAAAAGASANAKPADDGKPVPSGPLKSRKELREGSKVPARGMTDEQMRHIRSVAGEDKKDDDSVLGMLLFLLFVVLLPYATPVLVDPEHTPLPKLLLGREKIVAAAFGVLTTIALVRTWALQIRAQPSLMRPMTTTLKIVSAAIIILLASWFLPSGALGPVHRAAAMALPWGAAGFYVFLAMYGLARAVREAGQGALRAIGMTALYLTAFFGSYQVMSTTILVDAKRKAAMRAQASALDTKLTSVKAMDGLLAGSPIAMPDAGIAPDKPMAQRTAVGASEADDMASINQLGEANQKKGKQLADFSKKLGQLAK